MKKAYVVLTGLVIFLFTLFTARFYISPDFPYTHDGENHLARFANYKIAVRELQIPPRIAPVLHNHFGYPVFNYNYPLANILSLPFSFIGISYETTFSLLVVSSLLFGSVGLFVWLGYFAKKHWVKLFVTLYWLSTPFLVSTLAFRGNIGEVMAYSLLPWMFVVVHLLGKKQTTRQLAGYSVLVAAYLLSHNITVVFSVPILVGYAICVHKKDFAFWKRASIPAAISVLVTLWFWLPAVAEMSATVVGSSQNQMAFAQHFVTFRQLVASPVSFGYSLPGGIDSLGFKIGFLELVSIGTSFLLSIYMLYKTKKSEYASFWLSVVFLSVVGIVSVLFQLQVSQPLWQTVPFLRFMQFPWRWTLFFFTVFSPILAVLLARAHKIMWMVFVIGWLLYFSLVAKISPADTFSKENIDYEHFTQTTSTQNENMAKDFTYPDIGGWQPTASTLQEKTNTIIKTEFWNGRQHLYRVHTTEDVIIVEPAMYFPGWQTTVNGQRVEYVDSDQIEGRLAFDLSPGEYYVETEFTQYTPSRIIGNTSFFLAGIVLVYLAFGSRKKV